VIKVIGNIGKVFFFPITMASQTNSTSVDSLFPELLFGLLGHIGGAFVRDTVAHDDALIINPVQLSPLVDWIAPPER
jgi:hypothetical protein